MSKLGRETASLREGLTAAELSLLPGRQAKVALRSPLSLKRLSSAFGFFTGIGPRPYSSTKNDITSKNHPLSPFLNF